MRKQLSLSDYKPTLPDLLLQLCDQVIRFDRAGALCFQNLHHPIDDLLSDYPAQPRTLFWLYLDPHGQQHLLLDCLRPTQFPPKPRQTPAQPLTFQHYTQLVLSPSPFILSHLDSHLIKGYRSTHLTCLDQLRMRAESGRYYEPRDFLRDFARIVNWNIIYRVRSGKGLGYVSGVIAYFYECLAKRGFARRFQERRRGDLMRLFKFELEVKVESKQWPSIPTQFREYEPITKYIPVPDSRASIIDRRLLSKKTPVQCPKDCPCLLPLTQRFCHFSLASGTWQTSCPNRSSKIQCNHLDQSQHLRCRNSEIRKRQRKTCRVGPSVQANEFDLEECIIWGIDYFTRKNIFTALPERGIREERLVENNDEKNQFIDECLLTAVNFLGNQGYDMRKACEFIVENTQGKEAELEEGNLDWRYVEKETGKGNCLFKRCHRMYAQCLIKIIDISPDPQAFRVHSKGKGARCLNKQGIKASQFIVEYYGQIYEPWRWYQRQDFTKKLMKQLKMSESIPDFYNIYLQKHKDQVDGHDLLIVDPIHKGNYSSRFSHSCNPNCGTITTVSDGKYYIGMYALRDIQYGQQLTFDYCSTTESKYQHTHAICLCGTKQCIGYYLQLSISKPINTILDKHYCFLQRTVVLLKAGEEQVEEVDLELLARHNIKGNVLDNCPKWLVKWMALVMRFLEFQSEEYEKMYLREMLEGRVEGKVQGGGNAGGSIGNTGGNTGTPGTPRIQEEIVPTEREKVYAEIGKHQLLARRFQNLTTTIDKLKYYLTSIHDMTPPLSLQTPQSIYSALWSLQKSKQPSVMLQLQQNLQRHHYTRQLLLIESLDTLITNSQSWPDKLLLIRYAYLLLSHQIKTNKFNLALQNRILSDILYMYAFTHHYFTPHEYQAYSSEQVVISPKEFLNFSSKKEEIRKKDFHETRKYSSQFVWGQLVAWYKQTIAQPQASLSQDRRGTLSFPTIETIIRSSTYPFQGNTRENFLKALQEKPHSSWPPDKGPSLSYKNAKKNYGTMLFQSHYSSNQLQPLTLQGLTLSSQPGKKLISATIQSIDLPLAQKVDLFTKCEHLITKRSLVEITAVLNKYNFEENEYEESKRSYEHKLEEKKRVCKKLKKE